jgi:hypothetical protein
VTALRGHFLETALELAVTWLLDVVYGRGRK